MVDNEIKYPLYAKTTIFIVGLISLFAIFYLLAEIIVPIIFSIIIAILLNPVVKFFTKRKINRVIAIVFAIFLTFLVIAGFATFMVSQFSRFGESWPLLVDKFTAIVNSSITQISGFLDINPQNIHDWISKTKGELINSSGSIIGQTILSVGNTLVVLFLVPVYVFMILFYEPLIIDFIRKIFIKNHQGQGNEIISQTKTVIQRYLVGLVIEFVLVAILNSVALLLLGIDYAILIGIIGALLNTIPYIGGLIAVALPMIVALTTKENGWYAIYVLASYYFIQLIDNNYIVPKIVASKVKINALFSVIAVIAGNALWGVPGMFLSIPLLAIVKLIFDHIEPLKPWGFLLGDTMPSIHKIKPIFMKKLKPKTT
jgi:predicted PurR-regulated permease PerM